MGNDSASKVDESALGPWVRVVRKSRNTSERSLSGNSFNGGHQKDFLFRTDSP